MKLKTESRLSNQTINGIVQSMTGPLHEAARLGYIATDPAASLRKLGNDTREKGIPTEEEICALLSLVGLDPRARCAILLGAACALRIGEIQALTMTSIGEDILTVSNNWGKMEGMTDRYDHATAADLADLRDAQEAKILPFLHASGQ
ncbi:MAG: hypothetical protein ACLQMF_19325 [Rectinemataceae bacterium]